MFFTQHADFVQIQREPALKLNGKTCEVYAILADHCRIGVCMPMSKGIGWVCVLNGPVGELLTAPTRNDVIGLALRTAQEICAKIMFDP